jgi:Nucleotidyltransferase of unknown function (DUF6036)
MTDAIARFLAQLDAALLGHAREGERLDLYHIGRSALILEYGLRWSTRDFDVVLMRVSRLEGKALELFGQGTANSAALGLYLDPVPQGLPPLPQRFRQRCRQVPGDWKVLRLWSLEPHDYAATKLKSFRPKDREDLQFLCDQGVLDPVELRRSLESAFVWVAEKDGDPDRDRAFQNLQRVIDYLEGKSRSL